MLNELLTSANSIAAGLKTQKEQFDARDGYLLEKEIQLESLELLSETCELQPQQLEEVQKLRDEIKYLAQEKREEAGRIAAAERELETEVIASCYYIRTKKISLSEVTSAEDGIIADIVIAEDENRIISALITAEEEALAAREKYNEWKRCFSEAENDARLICLQNEYYDAKAAAEEFGSGAAQAAGLRKPAAKNEEIDVAGRLARAKAEYEKLIDEYGLTNIYNNIQTSYAVLCEASQRLRQAKEDAGMIPLTAPVSPVKKGGGIVMTTLLSHKHYGRPETDVKEPETPEHSQPPRYEKSESANYAPAAEEDDYGEHSQRLSAGRGTDDDEELRAEIFRAEAEFGLGEDRIRLEREISLLREETRGEMDEILQELRAVRRAAAQEKSVTERAKSEALMVHRAKLIVARRIKKEIEAERRREQIRRLSKD